MIKLEVMPYVATEINEIFKYMPIEVLQKIPTDVRKYFYKIASKDYEFKYDESRSLNEQGIRKETKEIIAIIYRDYICDDKEAFLKRRKQVDLRIEEEKKEKYNVNVFTNNISEDINNKLLENKKNNIFKKIISFLKNIFKI